MRSSAILAHGPNPYLEAVEKNIMEIKRRNASAAAARAAVGSK